ncbi:MAG: hypothetical protein JZU65_09745 [Chlorobium sp.]|jgi:hypothetical protein|nr:hypothetical protein [Chlorobium sp.]
MPEFKKNGSLEKGGDEKDIGLFSGCRFAPQRKPVMTTTKGAGLLFINNVKKMRVARAQSGFDTQCSRRFMAFRLRYFFLFIALLT